MSVNSENGIRLVGERCGRTGLLQLREEPLHCCGRREQGTDRHDDHREAQRGDVVVGERRCLAAFGPVEQQRYAGELGGDAFDLGFALEGFDEQHVGTCLDAAGRTAQRFVEAVRSACIRACDQHEVVVTPRRSRGSDLGVHLVGIDDLLVLHVAALLGQHLVLDVDTGDSGLLVLLHRAQDVDLVAVAGVGVGHDGKVGCVGDAAGVVDHLGEPEQADVGATEQGCSGTETSHVHGVEAGLFDEPSAERVVAAGQDDRRFVGDRRREQ